MREDQPSAEGFKTFLDKPLGLSESEWVNKYLEWVLTKVKSGE